MNFSSTAIVLLNYNSVDYLQQFLPVLVQHSPKEAKIYVIDNNSSDNSQAYITGNFPQVQWIQLTENLGYAGGYAQGLLQVAEEYQVLLNSDIEVTNNWLPPLIACLKSDKELAAIQPKIKSYHHQTHFEHAGAAGGFIDFLGYPFCRGRIFNLKEEDTNQYDDFLDCFWTSGACMVVKKSAYEAVGGFDSRFFMHMEEIDLCWRLQRAGYHVACQPESVVYHVGGGSLPYESPRKFYFNFRNNLILLQKNESVAKLLWLLPARMVLDVVAAVRELLQGKPAQALAVIKAWFAFLGGFFSWRGKFNHSKRNPIATIYKKSILFDFFFLKRQKFSSLQHENSHRRSQRISRQ